MSDFFCQLPFLLATFALALGLFPEDVLGWFDDEFDPSDLFYLLASAIVFAIGLATTYIVAIESFGADLEEPRPRRE